MLTKNYFQFISQVSQVVVWGDLGSQEGLRKLPAKALSSLSILQGGSGTEPKPETGTAGTVFSATEELEVWNSQNPAANIAKLLIPWTCFQVTNSREIW